MCNDSRKKCLSPFWKCFYYCIIHMQLHILRFWEKSFLCILLHYPYAVKYIKVLERYLLCILLHYPYAVIYIKLLKYLYSVYDCIIRTQLNLYPLENDFRFMTAINNDFHGSKHHLHNSYIQFYYY